MAILKTPVSSDDHIQGSASASITLVEYGDFQCPYCAMAYPIVKQLQKHFGKQLRFVFRNFPLAEVHPFAKPAAETAEFAGTFDQYWEMHDLIYETQEYLSNAHFFELAGKLGLPTKELELALRNKTFEPKIQKDFIGGTRSGVNGTPTFFINDQRYDGPMELESMIHAIESVFAK